MLAVQLYPSFEAQSVYVFVASTSPILAALMEILAGSVMVLSIATELAVQAAKALVHARLAESARLNSISLRRVLRIIALAPWLSESRHRNSATAGRGERRQRRVSRPPFNSSAGAIAPAHIDMAQMLDTEHQQTGRFFIRLTA
ncbi:hypothetical protein WI73_13215 [Burkholderia ubonensis]|nr:hypothetical protein WI36_00340 [Burkholderia ubonensis]KVC70463.1 hypothetical protein WI73_13215 [Burkholderia ubonensis]